MWNSSVLFPQGDSEGSSSFVHRGAGAGEIKVISRPRLPAAMATRAPLNVVHGPRGIGKTVLLTQWQEQFRAAGHGVVWIDATLVDETPDAFWREVLRGLDPGKLPVDVEQSSHKPNSFLLSPSRLATSSFSSTTCVTPTTTSTMSASMK